MNYNTDQWLIFNYPLGAGGKFLIACFFQFNNVAHWSGRQLDHLDSINWYVNSLPKDREVWPNREIDTPWALPDISRAWPRGHNTTEQEFSSKITGIEPFWNRKLKILDFWHKTIRPVWWTNADFLSIYVDDVDLYKKLMFSKLFELKNNTVICHDQRPDIGREANQIQKKKFQNQWIWKNVNSIDEFYTEHIQHLPWYQSWNFDQVPAGDSIALSELFDSNLVYQFMLKFEERFNQTVSKNYINSIHQIWKTTTLNKINLL
jgi:hypothetical protein